MILNKQQKELKWYEAGLRKIGTSCCGKMRRGFVGRSVARQQNMSEKQKIDSEIRKIVDKKDEKFYRKSINSLKLLTYETLSGEEIENLINKNIYPADKQDLKVEDDKGSVLSKPKIVH